MDVSNAPPGHNAIPLLLVDDDAELCELVGEYLGGHGFQVEAVHTGRQGVEEALSGRYSIALLDVMMPGIDGFETLRRIRAASDTPVLMLTARGEDVDRIVGLELGADDYLPKPFNSRELLARIHAILRRGNHVRDRVPPTERLVVGDVDLDAGARVVRCGGQVVELTGIEFDLLEMLLESAGRVVARDDLFRTVLGRKMLPYDRSLDMHISKLRKKLGPQPGDWVRIKTVRGRGYIYALPDSSPDGEPPVDSC